VFDSQVPEKHSGDAQAEGEYRPWGGQGVHWEALSAAGKKVEAPVLKSFVRLSLLQ
jgi:elongator complex protein 1